MGKKALMPPLGLITIAALTPPQYNVRLVDLNCESLRQEDLAWADLVCLSAMLPQRSSLFETAEQCKAAGKLVVFGGPFPTACPDECALYADVLVLNEGEMTWREFLSDFETGIYNSKYTNTEKPELTKTPVPRFDLLKISDYTVIPLQFSRGCPYRCEFCDIIVMFGRKPRTKTAQQMLAELQAVYEAGYRGAIFIVDDNFIGNRKEAAKFLDALVKWNADHGNPFIYGTEASVNLADEPDLLRLMVMANFTQVFLGIETPELESLKETLKFQNMKGPLTSKVETIQRAGLQVFGGFIIGFDHDQDNIFDRQIKFITDAAIPQAMIGPLVALPGTPLYDRMRREGRLVENTGLDEERTVASGYSNILTKIPANQLIRGQCTILETIYTPAAYFGRALETFSRLPHPSGIFRRFRRFAELFLMLSKIFTSQIFRSKFSFAQMVTQYRSLSKIPFTYYTAYSKFAWNVLRRCPDQLPWTIEAFFFGYHFYRFTFDHAVPGLSAFIQHTDVPRYVQSETQSLSE
jgi:radical SAM superfamily enzyme YgiQ (UPF0313 family)